MTRLRGGEAKGKVERTEGKRLEGKRRKAIGKRGDVFARNTGLFSLALQLAFDANAPTRPLEIASCYCPCYSCPLI